MYSSSKVPGLVKVLKFLQTHNTEYLSGQDLSDVLHISRVAVWKHIKKIQELGYKIESKQKLGYKLVTNSELLLPWEVTSELKTRFIGQQVFYYTSIDSTQTRALKMAKPENNGAVIIAKRQTKGKGRSERRWISPDGGIWMSVILYPKFDIDITTLFPIAASLALAQAIEKVLHITPELKWPNDIMIEGKKVAGILVDAALESNKVENLIVGVGINFNVNTKQIKADLEDPEYKVTSLKKYNKSPVQLVQQFLVELEKIHDLLERSETRDIITQWTSRSSTIKKKVAINTIHGKIIGRAIRIDNDGALVISSEKKESHRIIAGDIIHL